MAMETPQVHLNPPEQAPIDQKIKARPRGSGARRKPEEPQLGAGFAQAFAWIYHDVTLILLAHLMEEMMINNWILGCPMLLENPR